MKKNYYIDIRFESRESLNQTFVDEIQSIVRKHCDLNTIQLHSFVFAPQEMKKLEK